LSECDWGSPMSLILNQGLVGHLIQMLLPHWGQALRDSVISIKTINNLALFDLLAALT
jgi:hypothetical protein